jgi:hypothetical protein
MGARFGKVINKLMEVVVDFGNDIIKGENVERHDGAVVNITTIISTGSVKSVICVNYAY